MPSHQDSNDSVRRSGSGQHLALRGLDGVADWSPPGHTYASGAQGGGTAPQTAPK